MGWQAPFTVLPTKKCWVGCSKSKRRWAHHPPLGLVHLPCWRLKHLDYVAQTCTSVCAAIGIKQRTRKEDAVLVVPLCCSTCLFDVCASVTSWVRQHKSQQAAAICLNLCALPARMNISIQCFVCVHGCFFKSNFQCRMYESLHNLE